MSDGTRIPRALALAEAAEAERDEARKELEFARSNWENAVNGQVAAENALKAIHAKVVYRLQGGDLATDTRCLVEIAAMIETILPTE